MLLLAQAALSATVWSDFIRVSSRNPRRSTGVSLPLLRKGLDADAVQAVVKIGVGSSRHVSCHWLRICCLCLRLNCHAMILWSLDTQLTYIHPAPLYKSVARHFVGLWGVTVRQLTTLCPLVYS
jgi:hypothetical protein